MATACTTHSSGCTSDCALKNGGWDFFLDEDGDGIDDARLLRRLLRHPDERVQDPHQKTPQTPRASASQKRRSPAAQKAEGPQMKYLPACLVALISAAEAQIALNADLYATYTDNVFLTASQRGDLMQSAYIDFDYQFDGDLSLYYSGNANVFSENADLFNHLHSFGASYARPLGAAGLFFSGASLSLRLDRPLYSYRDFAVGRAFASFEPYLHPELITRLDYTFSYQNFLNAADYSYREQHLDAQLTHYLPTRTTLQLNGELGP